MTITEHYLSNLKTKTCANCGIPLNEDFQNLRIGKVYDDGKRMMNDLPLNAPEFFDKILCKN